MYTSKWLSLSAEIDRDDLQRFYIMNPLLEDSNIKPTKFSDRPGAVLAMPGGIILMPHTYIVMILLIGMPSSITSILL